MSTLGDLKDFGDWYPEFDRRVSYANSGPGGGNVPEPSADEAAICAKRGCAIAPPHTHYPPGKDQENQS